MKLLQNLKARLRALTSAQASALLLAENVAIVTGSCALSATGGWGLSRSRSPLPRCCSPRR
jgi:hypothetical protein